MTLPCPHSHHVPDDIPLEFYCPQCRTNHKLPHSYLSDMVLKSHGEFLDKILLKQGEVNTQVARVIEGLVEITRQLAS